MSPAVRYADIVPASSDPKIILRLTPELRDWLKQVAQREHRSVNGQIVHILERARTQDMESEALPFH